MQPWEIVVLICLLTLCCVMSYVAGRLHQQLKDEDNERKVLQHKANVYDAEIRRMYDEVTKYTVIRNSFIGGSTHASKFVYQDTDGLKVKDKNDLNA